jgi:transposase InsO family protein
LLNLQRSSARYVAHPRTDEAETVALIRAYAHEQPMYGYRIIAAMLKHDGFRINRKRVYRIWRQQGLQLPRRKTGKRRIGDSAGTLCRASHPNEVWTYDCKSSESVRQNQG